MYKLINRILFIYFLNKSSFAKIYCSDLLFECIFSRKHMFISVCGCSFDRKHVNNTLTDTLIYRHNIADKWNYNTNVTSINAIPSEATNKLYIYFSYTYLTFKFYDYFGFLLACCSTSHVVTINGFLRTSFMNSQAILDIITEL